MPIAEFRLPDGRIAEFRVPEGTTPEQAIAFANDYIAKNPNQFAPPPVPEVQAQAPTPPLAAAAPSTPPVPGGEPSIFDYFTDREGAIARERASRAQLQETLQQAERADIATQTGFFDRLGDLFSRGVLSVRSGIKDVEAAIETDPTLKAQFAQEARRFAADTAMPITGATTEEDVKDNFLRNVVPYIVEKGAESLPQMIASTNPLGVLGVALPSNIGMQAREAAGLEGRQDVSLGDVAAVTPGAAAVTALDTLGLGGILATPAKTALGRIGKAALLEGSTEAIQSAIEYANPRVVTGSDVDAGDLFERAAFGALAGAGVGGGLRATGEVLAAPFKRGEADTEEAIAGVTNAINKDPYDPQVLDEATQSLINNGVTPELAARVVANQAERAKQTLGEAAEEAEDGTARPDIGGGEPSVPSPDGAGAVRGAPEEVEAAAPPGVEAAGRLAEPDIGRTGAGESPLGAEQAPPAKYGKPPNTVAQVNAALAAEGIPQTLQKGKGYFYFTPSLDDAPEIPSVYTNSIKSGDLGWWVDYARSQHIAAMEKRGTPDERAAVLAKFQPRIASETAPETAPPVEAANKIIKSPLVGIGGAHPKWAEFEAEGRTAVQQGVAEVAETKRGPIQMVNFDDAGTRTIMAFDTDGRMVGVLDYATEPDESGRAINPNVYVEEDWRRQGVATKMYDLAERTGGLIPDVDQPGQVRTEEGTAFRAARAAPTAPPVELDITEQVREDFAPLAEAERLRAPVSDEFAPFDLDTYEPDLTPLREAPSMKQKMPVAREIVTGALGQLNLDLKDPVIEKKVLPQAAQLIAQRANKPDVSPATIIRSKLEEHGVELPPVTMRAAPEGVGTPTSAPMGSGAVALPRFPAKPTTPLTPEQEAAIKRVEPGVAQGVTTQAMQKAVPAAQREKALAEQEEARVAAAEERMQTVEQRVAAIASTYDAMPVDKRIEAFEDAELLDPGDPAGPELAARNWGDLNASEKFKLANTLYVEPEAKPLSASAVDYTADKELTESEKARRNMGEKLMAARSAGKISNAQYAQLTNMLRPTSAMAERGAEMRVTPATITDVGTKLDALVKQNKGKDMRSDVFYSLPSIGKLRNKYRRTGDANQLLRDIDALLAKKRQQGAPEGDGRGMVSALEVVRQAVSTGRISPQAGELAVWVLRKNPDIAKELTLSTEAIADRVADGVYYASEMLAQLSSSPGDTTTVHEIMHHAERLMPLDIRDGIAQEWRSTLLRTLKQARRKKDQALIDYIGNVIMAVHGDRDAAQAAYDAMSQNQVARQYYQLFNPSEFWAENASAIIARRASDIGWVAAAREWLRGLAAELKRVLGLANDAYVLRGIDSVLEGGNAGQIYGPMVAGLVTPFTPEEFRSAPSGPSGVNAKALEQIALSNTSTGIGEGVSAAVKSKDPSKPIFTAIKDNWRSMKPGLIGTLSKGMPTSAITDIIEGELPIMREINNMLRTTKSTTLRYNRAFSRLVDRVNDFVRANKNTTTLGDAMHLSRLLRYNPLAHSSLQEALAKDEVIQRYRTLLGKPNLSAGKQADYTAKLNSRVESLEEVWKKWDALGKQEGGHALYKDIAQFYRNMYNVQRTLLDERIMRLPISQVARLNLLDAVRLQYETARAEPDETFPELQASELPEAYFPFMRHGDYWMRIEEGPTGPEFYTFDTAIDRDNFARTRARELGVDLSVASTFLEVGNDLQELRDRYFLGERGESAALKAMFSIIDTADISTAADKEQLKDQLYQVYLNTLPERSIRKQFIHSKNRTGFSADVFRNVQASASRYANQLTDLEYADQLRGLIKQAGIDVQNVAAPLDRPRLAEYVKTMDDRVEASLNPGAPNAIVNGLNRFAFMWLLTSAGTAIANLTSVPIRVLPRLASIYGYGNTLKLFTKYSRMWDTFGITETHLDGSVTHQLSMLNSAIVKKNPMLRRAANDLRNSVAILDTPTTEILHTKDSPMRPEGAIAKTKEASIRVMSSLFNISDRMAREMSALMAFELEYNKARKSGLDIDAAYDKAMNTAMDTVERTLGITSEYERPPIMRGPIARVIFLFKFYAAQQTKFLIETMYKSFAGATPAERSQAMQELTGALLMGAMFHGMVGLPLISTVAAAIDLILEGIEDDEDRAQRMLEDETTAFSSLARLRYNILPKYFGDITIKGLDGVERPLSLYIEVGPISAWTGGNIGSRTSMDNLWFRAGEAGETYAESFKNFLLANLGPSVSLGENMARAVDDFARGDIQRGAEKVLPAFVKAPVTAARLSKEGEMTPRADARVTREELADLNIVSAALGVQPTVIASLKQRQFQMNDFENKAKRNRTSALRRLNIARKAGNDADLAAAFKEIDDYNKRYGVIDRFLITDETIANSWDNFTKQRVLRGMLVSKEQAMSAAEAIGQRINVPE